MAPPLLYALRLFEVVPQLAVLQAISSNFIHLRELRLPAGDHWLRCSIPKNGLDHAYKGCGFL